MVISECAIMAGIHFVELCGQHVTFMEGREEIDEEIKQLELGMCMCILFENIDN